MSDMNDCIWYEVCARDGAPCDGCARYLSANSDEGHEIYEQYDKDVHEALKPVGEKYEKLMNEAMADSTLQGALDRRAAGRLREVIAANTDKDGVYSVESGHIAADELLCDVLVGEGYTELVDVFKSLGKWYS